MPNTPPQPGRISPTQAPGKIPAGASGSSPTTTPDTKQIISDPMGAATSAATGQSAAADNSKRLNKALRNAHKSGTAPRLPQYRLSLFEGGVLIAITIVIDIIEFIAGLLAETVVGEIINIIIDLIVAIAMTVYCAGRLKMTFAAHWQRYASIWGAFIGEAIPVIDVCSFWTLDAWYIIHTIRSQDRAVHQQLMQTIEQEHQEEARQEWIANYEQQQEQERAAA